LAAAKKDIPDYRMALSDKQTDRDTRRQHIPR